MLLAACRLVLGAGLALGCVVGSATAAAHPPEFHRARMARQGDVEREPTEADRQAAWFALEFLTAFVARVGSPLADLVVAQSIDEHRFATKAPGARGLADLEESRGEVMAKLREQHGSLRVTWDGKTLAAEEPLPPLDRARGLDRHLIVELTQTTAAPARMTVGVSGNVIQADP